MLRLGDVGLGGVVKCKHFRIEELVSPKVFKDRGQNAWKLLDPRLLVTIDALVDKFGPMIVNDWLCGGHFDQRGLRSFADYAALKKEGIWLTYGQHEAGRAIDCHFKNTTVKAVREYILAHPAEFPHIKGVEIASWLHIDVRNGDTVEVFTV